MGRTALSLSSLILSLILLVSGNAFLTSVLGLRLSIEEFSSGVIGWILVFYSFGFVAGSLYANRIINKVGHIRAFAVFAAILAAVILIHPLAVETVLWAALRALAGFVMAGLMIVVESWFSSKATNKNRASLFAVYQVIFFLSSAGGQVLIRVADPAEFVPFSLAAILVTLALVPLSMTKRESPTIEPSERMSLRRLYRTSPVGTLGALVGGILITSFYTMGPVFGNQMGLDAGEISNFMAAAIIAAMLLAWPVGRLCDHFDRNRIMLVASCVAAVASLSAALVGGFNIPLLVFSVGVFIGISATLYPIAVAMTNDLMESHQITAASTALLLSYGVGSCIGPVLSALFMDVLGPRGLFVSNALVLGGVILFLMTARKQPTVPVEEQEQFYTVMPEATLGLAELDPRAPEIEEDGAMEEPRS
jgi:MFS family permease